MLVDQQDCTISELISALPGWRPAVFWCFDPIVSDMSVHPPRTASRPHN